MPRKNDPLFEKLQAIIDGDLTLDDLKTDIVEVKLWDEASANAYPAIKEECYIEIVSYGGDTTGYQIPFNVHYTGVKTKGTFNLNHQNLYGGVRQNRLTIKSQARNAEEW